MVKKSKRTYIRYLDEKRQAFRRKLKKYALRNHVEAEYINKRVSGLTARIEKRKP